MMGYDGGAVASTNSNGNNEGSSSISSRIDGEKMWQTNSGLEDGIEGGNYPQRPGERDCDYYIRTGLCKFGLTCRFNHPPNRKLVLAAARMRGGYPERVGQPECQYYLKTGTCKFGATCKFHHPKDKAGIADRVQLNILGYPLRTNEQECAYYLRTGQCKFGSTCKFHHPQPSGVMAAIRGSTVYPSVHSPTSSGRQSYSGPTNWPLSRPPFIPSPRWQGASSYAQFVLPQGLVQVSGWNTYPASSLQGQLGSSTDNQQQVQGSDPFFNSSRQSGTNTSNVQGSYPSYRSSSVPMGLYTFQRENVFPERPGEPECQYYMKTGDCKFGAVCRFHHPKERTLPIPNCMLSPIGLPLRPGEPLCVFYSRYGTCKFGPNCKFDHPMGTVNFGYSPFLTGNGLMPLSYDESVEAGSGKARRLSLQESRQVVVVDENEEE